MKGGEMKRNKQYAITVSHDYLLPEAWSIKLCVVGKRRDGKEYWHVLKRYNVSTAVQSVMFEGQKFADKHHIPFIPFITHGNLLSAADKKVLQRYRNKK